VLLSIGEFAFFSRNILRTNLSSFWTSWLEISLKDLVLLEASALLNVKVDGADFWVWSTGIDPNIGVGGGDGGGSGGGVGGIAASNAGADFNGGNIGTDFNTDNVGADFEVGNVRTDSDASSVGVDFDESSSSVSADGKACLSGITSSIISRGGECTSTMLCCVLSFPFDWEVLSVEEVLDLLLLLMVPLYALMSSVK
jgi:hypothetical protein